MILTATHINYYIVCPRKLWLSVNGINMEHTSDVVYDGKLLHENSYPQRAQKYQEVELSTQWEGLQLNGKVDFYDTKEHVIHETKRGNKVEVAHEWQVKFYIWLFELNGIEDVSGKIEYPLLRITTEVNLSDDEKNILIEIIPKINETISRADCPTTINGKICKSCSYYEFCYINEI
ncbi:CRISPR-associated protein Cas4 [Porphyromonas pogonae]|uniref:CRISPR-associated protein Cas4 n=1 Tax=Porphyromonas pogonae TaxID=867595 RepID=UPI002E798737|nr:CRISPR-associated protein Cas4 [Porphyromonas pogonae]